MTWKTSKGVRHLTPAEAKLWASVLNCAIEFDLDRNYAGFKGNAGPFDQLSTPRKYTVLLQVAQALLFETPETPKLTALNEGAIWFVYEWLFYFMEDEADLQDAEDTWGKLILDTIPEDCKEEDEEDSFLPTIGCLDTEKWSSAIEMLADRILWDRDFTMGDLFEGKDPDQCRGLMAFLRIDFDYYKPFEGRATKCAKERLKYLLSQFCD